MSKAIGENFVKIVAFLDYTKILKATVPDFEEKWPLLHILRLSIL